MKRFFILSLLTTILFSEANCQIQKGALRTGGRISFNTKSDHLERKTSDDSFLSDFENDFLALNPQIGVFLTTSFLLGAGIEYEYQYDSFRSSNNGSLNNLTSEKSSLILFNPYVQKFYALTDNLFFSPTLNLLIGGGTRKSSGSIDNREGRVFAYRINVTPELTYFISEKWAVSASIGRIFYNQTNEKRDRDDTYNSDYDNTDSEYGIDFSLNSFSVGFQYYLKNKVE
ncbi:hypothetical protein QQ020_18265 [Fulvivirgaceae bacterium BMA12]|uniref:Outer membrane protein beta-barrel domain-containing protein n=1 Tax=Agaribacillus aureus TaxID=3051825 RepID=A0ABT8L8C8_9BACT|nr:hypothetical protein [Fulvivirgaceae bacterium BMA12]